MKYKQSWWTTRICIESRRDIRIFKWRFMVLPDESDHMHLIIKRIKSYSRCPAHGDVNCRYCRRNQGNPICDQCGFYEYAGVHWDTCANRWKAWRKTGVWDPTGEWMNVCGVEDGFGHKCKRQPHGNTNHQQTLQDGVQVFWDHNSIGADSYDEQGWHRG